MRKTWGLSLLFAAAATAASAADYKVVMGLSSEDLYDNPHATIGIPLERPDAQSKLVFMTIDYRSYTLLAVNNHDEHIVCSGLLLTPAEFAPLRFSTDSKEAHQYLTPGTPHSYGSCHPVDMKMGERYEFNNTDVKISLKDEPRGAGINFPILGTDDPQAPRWMFDKLNSYIPLRALPAGAAPCPDAGFNEEHARAKKDDWINVGFCPR